MTEIAEEYRQTLQRFQSEFTVKSVATLGDLETCSSKVKARDWWSTSPADYDQFPVVDDSGGIIGMTTREHATADANALIADVMLPVAEDIIVSADTPIHKLFSTLRTSNAKLVLSENKLNGIVTRSDLLKLPVRVVLFGMISHMERSMAALIGENWNGSTFLDELSEGRREKFDDKKSDLQKRRLNPPDVEMLELGDKGTIVCSRIDKFVSLPSKAKFKKQVDRVSRLRDQVAHSSRYVGEGQETFDRMLESVNALNALIACFTANLKGTTP